MKKTLGIIGGMGPAATCDLMEEIIALTAAERDQDHIHVVADVNTSIPDRTAAILHGGEDPVPELCRSARRLRDAGAEILLMPCNTAHYFYDSVASAAGIPVLHMPRLTAAVLREAGVKKAAVLATDGTVQSGVYADALAREGVAYLRRREKPQAPAYGDPGGRDPCRASKPGRGAFSPGLYGASHRLPDARAHGGLPQPHAGAGLFRGAGRGRGDNRAGSVVIYVFSPEHYNSFVAL